MGFSSVIKTTRTTCRTTAFEGARGACAHAYGRTAAWHSVVGHGESLMRTRCSARHGVMSYYWVVKHRMTVEGDLGSMVSRKNCTETFASFISHIECDEALSHYHTTRGRCAPPAQGDKEEKGKGKGAVHCDSTAGEARASKHTAIILLTRRMDATQAHTPYTHRIAHSADHDSKHSVCVQPCRCSNIYIESGSAVYLALHHRSRCRVVDVFAHFQELNVRKFPPAAATAVLNTRLCRTTSA